MSRLPFRVGRLALRATVCAGAASLGAIAVVSGCAASAEVKFTGAAFPEVPVDEVDDLGEQAPAGFVTTGVVTTMCETMNGASGVLEAACTEAQLIAMTREQAAAKGGHGLVDTQCRKELLQRSHETLDGGGVKVTTRERLTCHATVVRWGQGDRPLRARTSATVSVGAPKRKALGDGETRVMVSEIPVDVAFAPTASFVSRKPRPVADVGELDSTPDDYTLLGVLAATCAATCAPRHGREAMRMEAARLGGTAIAAVHCEIAGADRWQCKGSVIGDIKVQAPRPPPPVRPEEPPTDIADGGGPPTGEPFSDASG